MAKQLKHFFDPQTYTLTYVVYDDATLDAVVIDPLLDFCSTTNQISHESIEEVAKFIRARDLKVHWLLETHAHADHLSGAHLLQKLFFPDSKIAISEKIRGVQKSFKQIFALGEQFNVEGKQFDRLLNDGEQITAGVLNFKVLYTPGHTPACSSYLLADWLFCGDSLFMPDYGVGRCDFPGGDAQTLYHSIQEKIYTLPDATKIFVGHDYLPNNRPLQFQTTVGEQKKFNQHLKLSTPLTDFVSFRTQRDKTLSPPKLFFPSLFVNINAGDPGSAILNGKLMIKFLTSAS